LPRRRTSGTYPMHPIRIVCRQAANNAFLLIPDLL
jgi:hypothetical protein